MAMDGASSSSTASTSAPTGRWTYDVFLSFRGEDTRNNFVDHLYAALDQAGLYTFKDDEKLQKGKSISPELSKAIQESMVAVVVFSKNYANSSWCLEELEKIIECQNLIGQKVLPVFYDVDPSSVRNQRGSYHDAFQLHEVNLLDDMEKLKRWREALATATSLSGWDVSRTASGREAECIKQIVSNISRYTESRPTEILIGMESRVRHVKSLLGKRPDDFCIIGIWGMGGIGKTTIARAVYHQISYEFEGSCFLEDVRENGSNKRGLKSLQEKLLSKILMQEQFEVKDCDDGMCQIRRRLSRKKVLVVLDDVDDIKQLQFLAGSHEWFGLGSRIMITTRDKHLLCNAQEKYAPELLRETEAMELFSRHAFKANFPPKEYEKLSGVVVSHTGHLPLALKVLGSHFCGRNLDFWQSGLNVLAKIPHKEINRILKLSFDGLNIFEQEIFLHIACFFKGKKRHNITRILDSFCLEAVSGITVLIEKSLLTTSNGYLHMHDLIQEMGWYVVRECYPNNMVWCSKEIKEVMTTTSRLETVEAIVETNDEYHHCCSAKVFKRMKKLRLLQVRGRFTSKEPKYFPEQLKWLRWFCYPFQSLTITRHMRKLVGLEMTFGWINRLQIEKKVILNNLKFVDLRYSQFIERFPDISAVPNLERLNLSYCKSLVEIHQSLLLHGKIIHLDLSFCNRLTFLPSVIKMKSLQSLHLPSVIKVLFKISLCSCPKLLMDQESHQASFLMKSLVQKCAYVNHRLSITVPISKIPDWFKNHRLGNIITLKLPQNRITKMTGLALCCRFSPPLDRLMSFVKIKFKVSGEESLSGRAAVRAAKSTQVVWTGYLSVDILGGLCHGFESEDLIITFDDGVLECGVCVVYRDDIKPMAGGESWIPDYDELRRIDHESTSQDWHHGRWSKPTFNFDNTKFGDHKTVQVWG